MFDRSLIVHTGIAVASLVLAYSAWGDSDGTDDRRSSVSVVSGGYGGLTKAVWKESSTKADSTTVVSVTKNAEGGAEVAVEKTAADGTTKTSAFPGTERADELFESLSDLKAERSLGAIDEGADAKFGLGEDSSKSLKLMFGEKEIELKVGAEAYGSGSYYVQGANADVYLVPSRTLSSLRHGATALLDRRAVGVKNEEIKRVRVSSGAKARELVHRYPGEAGKSFFADAAEPDRKLDSVSGWIRRALGIRVQELVDQTPGGDPAVTIQIFGTDEQLAELSIWASLDEQSALAKSSRFPKTLKVSPANVKRLLGDVDSVLEAAGDPG